MDQKYCRSLENLADRDVMTPQTQDKEAEKFTLVQYRSTQMEIEIALRDTVGIFSLNPASSRL
jgi:hypothetical protein